MLAVVLTITVIVLSILSTIPSSTDSYEDELTQQYWQEADIAIDSWAANGTDIKMKMRNNIRYPIQITAVYLESSLANSTVITLEPGESILASGDFIWNESQEGTIYEADVQINYQDTGTGNNYIFYGQTPLTGSIEDISLE